MTKEKNPLFESQREKAGSDTMDKYLYQYHWALFKIVTEHQDKNEYAVFIELHEDVVICDSLESGKAKFEFNQVKNTATPFNTYQLVGRKKAGKSVLGKLIMSGQEKPFSASIGKINLVSVKDYGLNLKIEDVKLKSITKSDLSSDQLKELEKELKKEIGVTELPANIHFVVTDFPQSNYQNATIGAIATLISSVFPQSYTNANNIYTSLIDELLRKGKESYDFTMWDEVLKNKALTSVQVTRVIHQFTNIKDESLVELGFTQNCLELGFNTLKTKQIRQHFNRYRAQRISNTSSLQLDTTKTITNRINNGITNGSTSIKEIIDYVTPNLPENIGKQFNTADESIAAIICEFIMMN